MWLRLPSERLAGTSSTTSRSGQPTGLGLLCKSHRTVCMHATAHKASKQPQLSTRNAQLYELSDDDGWGVEIASTTSVQPPAAQPARQGAKKKAAAPERPAKKARRKGTPYVDMRSEEGIIGLTLLQKHLMEQDEQQAAGQDLPADSSSLQAVRDSMAHSAGGKLGKKSKLPGFPGGAAGAAAAAASLAAAKQQQQITDDDDEYEDENASPEFEVIFDKGKMETKDYSSGTTSSSSSLLIDNGQEDTAAAGWQAEDAEFDHDDEDAVASSSGRQQGDIESSLLMDLGNEDDWGLDALNPRSSLLRQRQRRSGRRSLLDEIAAAEDEADGFEEGSLAASNSASVQWGGSAGFTGIDFEEQEQMLQRYFKPDQVKKFMKDQQEIDASYSELRKRNQGIGVSDHKYQQTLRIVSGTAAGKKLISFRGSQTRPMMEKVRQAIFNMIQAQAGMVNCLPKSARWLDLFAGTGSVGLEALSRGVKEAHFVEMDPIVVQKILTRNIAYCGFKGKATCHTTKAEDFLRRAAALPRFAGGPFDFISVCPPYLLVSYPELFDLLEGSPLVHSGSIVFVEYPKQLAHQVRDSIGPLQRVKDRKYGRTYVAVYAAADNAADDAGAEMDDDPFLANGL